LVREPLVREPLVREPLVREPLVREPLVVGGVAGHPVKPAGKRADRPLALLPFPMDRTLPLRRLRPSRLSATGRVWVLDGVLLVVAAALLWSLVDLPAPRESLAIPWWALALAFALSELAVVHIHFKRGSHSLTIAEIPLVVGLVFCAPLEVALAWATGSGLVLLFASGMPRVRVVFNIALFALAGGLAALVFHAVGSAERSALEQWAAALGATLVASLTAIGLIAVAMTLSGERLSLRSVFGMAREGMLVAAANASLAVALTTVLQADPWAGLTLLPVTAALLFAYRAYTAERAKHKSLEFLHAASAALTKAAGAPTGLAGILSMALATFRAECAEGYLFAAGDADAGLRVSVRSDEQVEALADLDELVAADVRELVGGRSVSLLVTPDTVGEHLAAHLRRLGVTKAILAPLPGDDGAIGALLVANRIGVGAFGRAEEDLFSTLGRQTGATLGQGRLGRQVRLLDELARSFEHKAFHDPLTALANRMLFMDRVRHALARRGGTAAVIYIDLDDFKTVNDSFGHDAGDTLLNATADRLRDSLRAEDTAARLGGDEFAVLLLDTDDAGVRVVVERLLACLRQPVHIAGSEHPVHASLGIASSPSRGMTAEELIGNADAAMYVSKHGGKRGYSVYSPAA
jgi:diguanylate cyclase (GGDEF)-like protein